MVVAITEHRIAYMPVPKVACTSVKAAILMLDRDPSDPLPYDPANEKTIHQALPTRRFRPHRWREYEGWWRFCLVRDPLKRLLSVYTDRIQGRRELHNSPKMNRQSVLPIDPEPDFFFQHLDRYQKVSWAVKHHSIPFRLFIGPAPLLYDRVFKVNEIGELAQELSERTGQKVEIPRLNKSGTTLTADDLRPETLGFIREYLKDDYELLADYYKPVL